MSALLETEALCMRFGGLQALDGVSLSVARGSITSIIGPNGAGKTTLFNCLSGIYLPTGGAIRFDGRDITRLPDHAVTARGIARTFQNIRLFAGMTVLENVLVGGHVRTRSGILAGLFGGGRAREEERRLRDRALGLLDFVGLSARAEASSRELSYGEQRRLEIARALAADPNLLLLDEPASGLNPQEARALVALIRKVREQDVTVCLIEHHMAVVMEISDRITVLDHGVRIAEGTSDAVRRDPRVIEAYLGTPGEA